MVQKSYTSNYIKIYFWQGISLVLNFLSMFIVIPYLTSSPTIYGIYSVCISVSIFLSYADIGFMGAGQKYAAEHFARGEIKEEIRVIGLTSFILLAVLLVFAGIFLYLSIHPELLIKNIIPGLEVSVASSLLFILALFTPVTLLQRLLQMIFGIRLEDYLIQRTNIVGSLMKIISVLWFFRNGQYDIVGYFLFVQIINLLAAMFTLAIARKRYTYDFGALLRAIRFNKDVFLKMKRLAFTSLYLTILWILYYELDPAAIGKFIGAMQVAVYAIGLTVLSFFRTIFGILFSPFSARFNHFTGIKDEVGLRNIYLQVTTIMAPLVVIPIVAVSLFARPLILSWVGTGYEESVEIAQLLVLCNFFAFITYPSSTLLIAQERIKEMYFVNTIIATVFWVGIISTYSFLGLKSFAIFKLAAFGISALVYYFIMIRFLKIGMIQSLKEIFKPLFLPVSFLIIAGVIVKDYLPLEKSKLNLLIVVITVGCVIAVSFVIQYFSSPQIRAYVYKTINLSSNKS